ncbi:MAG: hypothetical protein JSS20_15065, partial [Proteobacteria bacterium]|nr:hypothetical protein [Pseudomonadota bacterium]
GTSTRVFYNNAGVLGEYAISGTGSVAMTTAPTFSGTITGGTFSGGTWNGNSVGVAYGGTGTTTQFTLGSIVFAGASGVYTQDNSNFFYDNSNHRLGIGTSTLTQALTVNGNVDIFGTGAYLSEIANAGTTGTTLNKLAKLTGAPSTAVAIGTSDTSGVVGVVVGNAGTTGNAQIAVGGIANCVFENATVAGDYVQPGTSTAGACHDAGSTFPTSGQVIGRVLATGSAGTYAVKLFGDEILATSAGGSGNINTAISTSATNGGACSNLGQLGKDGSGHLYVCDSSPSTVSGGDCTSTGAGALTFDSSGNTYLCLQ